MAAKQAAGLAQRLEKEIADWRAKRGQCAADLDAARIAAGDAGKKRDSVLLAAKTEHNAEAVAALDDVTVRQERAEREANDLAAVLTQIDAKLVELAQAHAAAGRAAAMTQLRGLAAQRLALVEQVERHADALFTTLAEYLNLQTPMWRIANEHNFGPPSASALAQRFAVGAYLGRRLALSHIDVGNVMLNQHKVGISLLASERELLRRLVETEEPAAKTAA